MWNFQSARVEWMKIFIDKIYITNTVENKNEQSDRSRENNKLKVSCTK